MQDAGSGECSSYATNPMQDSRTTLILDLSSKVTEQEAEILRLREQLGGHSQPGGASGTFSAHSAVVPCHPKSAQSTGDHSTDQCRGPLKESGASRLQYDGHDDARNESSAGRTSQLNSAENYPADFSKAKRNVGSYRAHWASSCFDVGDLADGYAGADSNLR